MQVFRRPQAKNTFNGQRDRTVSCSIEQEPKRQSHILQSFRLGRNVSLLNMELRDYSTTTLRDRKLFKRIGSAGKNEHICLQQNLWGSVV